MEPLANSKSYRILIVEDEAIVASDLQILLTRAGYTVVGVADDAQEALALAGTRRPELALVDIRLRGKVDGIELARRLYEELEVPSVFATAHGDTATLTRARESAPFGYVVKPFDEQSLCIAIEVARARVAAETKIRALERWLSLTLRSIGDGVIVADEGCKVTLLNPMAEVLSGWSATEAQGRRLAEVFSLYIDGEACSERIIQQVVEDGAVFHVRGNAHLRKRGGALLPIDDSVARIRDERGHYSGIVVVFRDRTAVLEAEEKRRRLEAKMYESQRLESLGVLAAGVAHDFNNLLGVILGNSSLLATRVDPASKSAGWLANLQEAARRGADLCAQMLAYAGRGSAAPEPLDINELIQSTVQLLRISVSKWVHFRTELAPDLPAVSGERSRLQQMIMNLVLNASEALGTREGEVTLRTFVSEAEELPPDVVDALKESPSARFATVQVIDSGEGMSEEVARRIFDPFFTTKFQGRGLGLAAVRGIVDSHGGALTLRSTVGRGTTFTIYLPESAPTVAREQAAMPSAHVAAKGLALVVDDDEGMRCVTSELLRELGFKTHEATNAREAVERVREDPARYQLVLMDLTMPVMGGIEGRRQLSELAPGLPVILMSGYLDGETGPAGDERLRLHKPFSVQQLEAVLAMALHERSAQSA